MSRAAHQDREGWLRAEERLPSDRLLGYVHGTLTATEHEAVEQELRDHPELRRLLPKVQARVWMRRAPQTAVAAGIALAILWFAGRDTGHAAVGLALEQGRFGDAVRLMESAHLPRPAWPVVSRYGADETGSYILTPAVICFESRPRVEWVADGDPGSSTVRVLDLGDVEVGRWVATGTSSPWPTDIAALERDATYTVLVESTSGVRLHRSFTIASEDAVRAAERALGLVDDVADERVRLWLRACRLAELGDHAGAAHELGRLLERIGDERRSDLMEFLLDPYVTRILSGQAAPEVER